VMVDVRPACFRIFIRGCDIAGLRVPVLDLSSLLVSLAYGLGFNTPSQVMHGGMCCGCHCACTLGCCCCACTLGCLLLCLYSEVVGCCACTLSCRRVLLCLYSEVACCCACTLRSLLFLLLCWWSWLCGEFVVLLCVEPFTGCICLLFFAAIFGACKV
jgi:hypothetical protein